MLYFLAGKMENLSISLLRLGRALITRSVKAIKKVKEQKVLVCQFNVLANGINTKLPKSHTRKAAKRL
ncbi:MAG: hypothetical protein OEY95_01560 [Candidatus Bathyarchaeota archaeon]|nr:hypothetical protein [Candidatus Bathyarchaeota archaeon]